ncbi:hypothetical protein MRB53_022244 [Persea americana]|uniref:Uncharacterized protein n=1 Tax=Persea americana TaxID=3435 RepID=A0ACC2L684_PERAE|nr:hypothetical protein MRB53_022244 [Persea americana]
MEGRLLEAAIRGNKQKLVELLQEDPLILDQAMDECIGKESPLHLGALYGHVDFLIRFLLKKHNRALDVNAVNIDGCTPLDTSLKHVSGLARLKSDIALVTAGAKTATPIFGKGKTKMLNDNYGSWFMEALLVVALLMINIAFQAALNPPGGVLQDPSNAATSTSPSAVWQVTGNITLPNATLPNGIWQATGFGTLPDDTLPDGTHVGQVIISIVDPDQYKEFSKANNFTIIFSMLVIEILLVRCFVDNWLLDIFPIFLTSMSIVAMVSSYHVSHSFVSVEKMKTQHHLWGIGSRLKTSNLKDGANSSQSETACKN